MRASRWPWIARRWRWVSLASLGLGLRLAVPAAEPRLPLEISADQRHLVDRTGAPFLYQADTAWMLFLKLTESEAREYLAIRKRQGFNVIQVMLTGFLGMTNRAGELPFSGPALQPDLGRPNERYFAHVDRVLTEARRQELVVAIAPAWSGCCGEGWTGKDAAGEPKPLNRAGPTKARGFGRWLGGRYGERDHLVWILGGDQDPRNAFDEWRAMGTGLHETAPRHLITYHAASTHSSTDVWPATEPWLGVSMVYTYFRGFDKAWNKVQPDVEEVSRAEYAKSPVRPFFLGESTYEGEHGAWGSAAQARKQAYACLLSGGCGHAYGSPNWNFPETWRATTRLPGAESLGHLRTLLESRPWWLLAPDVGHRVAIDGRGPDQANDSTVTGVASDRSFALAYLPRQRALTVQLGALSGTGWQAWWWNPRDGRALGAGRFRQSRAVVFEPPDEGDWVLLVEDAGKGWSSPGRGVGAGN
jgi:hypothetical protein